VLPNKILEVLLTAECHPISAAFRGALIWFVRVS